MCNSLFDSLVRKLIINSEKGKLYSVYRKGDICLINYPKSHTPAVTIEPTLNSKVYISVSFQPKNHSLTTALQRIKIYNNRIFSSADVVVNNRGSIEIRTYQSDLYKAFSICLEIMNITFSFAQDIDPQVGN